MYFENKEPSHSLAKSQLALNHEKDGYYTPFGEKSVTVSVESENFAFYKQTTAATSTLVT